MAYGARDRSDELVASGLTIREAQAVRDQLAQRKFPFEFQDGGQAIRVPADQHAELAIESTQLAAARKHPATAYPLPGEIAATMRGVASRMVNPGIESLAQEFSRGTNGKEAP
jgi:hypothetical protein